MSQLKQLNLIHFKNHLTKQLSVNEQIIGFIGKNGTGKTNLLDAIYYLCFARSYFSKTDKILQINSNSGFRINGIFTNDEEEYMVSCILREDGKKELLVNNIQVPKVSEFLGITSCVMIAPDDIAIINEGSENRRKWMDSLFCQMDKLYLKNLQVYQKILVQRNALLKSIFEKKSNPDNVLNYYDEQLNALANYIYQFRKTHFDFLQEKIVQFYDSIAENNDGITVAYQSQLQESNLHELLQFNFQKDLYSQRTNYGIHKDDLVFTMQDELLKNIASQGQKKSFLLALKLAEFEFLKLHKNSTPILLLDDIFERLDDIRIQNLFKIICTNSNAQVFITDTNQKRVEENIGFLTKNYRIITL